MTTFGSLELFTTFAPARSKTRAPYRIAEIAQLVEQFIRNEEVAGSSPAFGSDQIVVNVCCLNRSIYRILRFSNLYH